MYKMGSAAVAPSDGESLSDYKDHFIVLIDSEHLFEFDDDIQDLIVWLTDKHLF